MLMGWSQLVGACLLIAVGSPASLEVRGQVVDEAGRAVVGATVYAVDGRDGTVTGQVASGSEGRFVVGVAPRRRHRFYADAADWSLVRSEKTAPGEIRLVMRRKPSMIVAGQGELAVVATAGTLARSAGGTSPNELLSGRMLDEAGHGLGGVRLILRTPAGQTVAEVDSGRAGDFVAAVQPGRYRIQMFAPGLRAVKQAEAGPNRWLITLGIAAGVESMHLHEDRPATDPDNPVASDRARLTFEGRVVSAQPRVTPALADLQVSRTGLSAARTHPVARQPQGAFCVESRQCSQARGQAVCCHAGEVADEYQWAGGAGGVCKPATECPGARKYRRPVR
jgi:hypothetical protein